MAFSRSRLLILLPGILVVFLSLFLSCASSRIHSTPIPGILSLFASLFVVFFAGSRFSVVLVRGRTRLCRKNSIYVRLLRIFFHINRIFWLVYDIYVEDIFCLLKIMGTIFGGFSWISKAFVLVLGGQERDMAFWRSPVALLPPAPSFLSPSPTLFLSSRTHPFRVVFFLCYLISCLLSHLRN